MCGILDNNGDYTLKYLKTREKSSQLWNLFLCISMKIHFLFIENFNTSTPPVALNGLNLDNNGDYTLKYLKIREKASQLWNLFLCISMKIHFLLIENFNTSTPPVAFNGLNFG